MAGTARVVPQDWSEAAEQGLARALGEDMPIVRAEVRARRAELFRVTGIAEGWMVWRREGTEAVIVAVEGRNIRAIFQALLDRCNAKTVRVHSARPGMGRLLAQFGFAEVERVYRLEL